METEEGSRQNKPLHKRVILLGISFIASVVFGSMVLAYVLDLMLNALSIQTSFDMRFFVRVLGLLPIGVGIGFMRWVFKYRTPKDTFVSSCLTVYKFFKRDLIAKPLERTEHFIPLGPHRFVRNPMYFSAIAITFGLGIAVESAVFLLWSLILAIWFWAIWIPFEEAELLFLFGDEYREYQRQVPKLLPYGRKYRVLAKQKM
ncbi:MAG: isoprenylcysteine carboxylmethyltransferase family protein [Thaumarchaeota archaeon]|nr:isoprenylcysteine carboxylmethyltransferase family protein [Nitrososphaerota archaeon]